MAKPTQADIQAKAQKWAVLTKKITKAEAQRDAELEPILAKHERQLKPVNERWDATIDPLQEKADALEAEIMEYLEGLKKTTRIESKDAVAEFVKGTKFGDRVVDGAKFVAIATERKIKDFWKMVKVTIKDAEKVLGKEDLESICTKPKVPNENASLTLKD